MKAAAHSDPRRGSMIGQGQNILRKAIAEQNRTATAKKA
jgi:hypothetical protein